VGRTWTFHDAHHHRASISTRSRRPHLHVHALHHAPPVVHPSPEHLTRAAVAAIVATLLLVLAMLLAGGRSVRAVGEPATLPAAAACDGCALRVAA
jgi:hypothetical protein